MIVLNAERKTGSFTTESGQTRDYDNLYFTLDTGDNQGMILGTRYAQIKVSVKDYNHFCAIPVEQLKGKNMLFAFDQNKKLIAIYELGK